MRPHIFKRVCLSVRPLPIWKKTHFRRILLPAWASLQTELVESISVSVFLSVSLFDSVCLSVVSPLIERRIWDWKSWTKQFVWAWLHVFFVYLYVYLCVRLSVCLSLTCTSYLRLAKLVLAICLSLTACLYSRFPASTRYKGSRMAEKNASSSSISFTWHKMKQRNMNKNIGKRKKKRKKKQKNKK